MKKKLPYKTDSGRTLRCIRAFSNEINQLLCSLNSTKTFVASTTNQIKIYEYDKFTKKSEFSFRNDLRIKFVKWMPHDDKLLVILNTDIICILSIICDTNALKLIRHYEPLKAREKFLRKSNNKIEMLNYVCDDYTTRTDDDDEDKIIKSVIQDYQNGIITDVTFHSNGNTFCVTFSDNSIMLCSAMLWDVRRVYAYPDFHIKSCQFVSSYLNGTNSSHNNSKMLLLTLTSNDDQMMLTCLGDLNSRMLIDMNNVSSFVLSTNGKLLINLHHTGDILAYNLENHLNALSERTIVTDTKVNHNAFNDEQQSNRKGLVEIQMKVNELYANF